MVEQTQQIIPTLPEYAKQPTVDMAKTLEGLMKQNINVPAQQVAGFSPTQLAAMQQAYGGIGAYEPY